MIRNEEMIVEREGFFRTVNGNTMHSLPNTQTRSSAGTCTNTQTHARIHRHMLITVNPSSTTDTIKRNVFNTQFVPNNF